jgi:hypothetical protein
MEIRDVAKLCALLILLVAVGFNAGCSSPSQAQSTTPSSQVLVVNTSAQPVPVVAQGTTNVNATVSNNVNALVTNASDSSGKPVPLVTDATTYAAHHDFFNQLNCKFNGVDCSTTQAFFIPANQTLVIESVTGFCNNMTVSGDVIQQVSILESVPFANAILIPGGTGAAPNPMTFAQATKAYFPSGANGQTASFSVVTANGNTEPATAQCIAYINGYLVQ